jgi:hypothetical protein
VTIFSSTNGGTPAGHSQLEAAATSLLYMTFIV